jgi:hypothetical protein
MEMFTVVINAVLFYTRFNRILFLLILLSSACVAYANPQLSRISCGQTAFANAGIDACSVYLTSTASSRIHIALTSDNPVVKVPSGVTVKPGAITTGFNATVGTVTVAQNATITAQAGGTTAFFNITLSPAVGGAALTLSTSSISFGNVPVGTTAAATVGVTSSGSAPVIISSISVAGSLFRAQGMAAPLTLNPGQTGSMIVTFSPDQANAGYNLTGVVTIISNAPTATLDLSGTGIVPTPSVSAIFCNSISVTGSLADICTVQLSGPAPNGGLNVALSSSSNAVSVPTVVLVPAAATSATFSANVSSVSTALSVTLTATTGSVSRTLSLQLNAAAPVLSVNASAISFGAVVVNNPATQTVTLSSTGPVMVTVNSLNVTGSGFSVSPLSMPAALQPGQTINVLLTFFPTAAGPATGQLTVISNSSTNSTLTIPLSGTATSPSYQVNLTWQAPASSVAGYHVYRASSGTTSYSLLNSAVYTQTAYTDPNVQSSSSYDYMVKSVDTSGTESSPSNVTTVNIP